MTAEKLMFAREMPTSIESEEMQKYLSEGAKGVHESIVRSYHIVQNVKEMIRDKWPLDAIAVAIALMEGSSNITSEVER